MNLKTPNQSPDSTSPKTRTPPLSPRHSLAIIHYFAHGIAISHPLAHPSSSRSFKPLIIPVLENPKKSKKTKRKKHATNPLERKKNHCRTRLIYSLSAQTSELITQNVGLNLDKCSCFPVVLRSSVFLLRTESVTTIRGEGKLPPCERAPS